MNDPEPTIERAPIANLLAMTCMGAADGTILALAASGRMHHWGAAAAVGLTVIAGAGAWIAAQQAFRGRLGGRDYALLGVIGLATVASTLAAAWLGVALGDSVTLHVLPKAAGVVLCIIGLEVGGVRLPSPRGLPAPIVALAVAGVVEVIAQWTP